MNENLKVIISAETSKLKKGLGDAKASVGGFKGEIEKAKKNVDDNMKKAGDAIGNGIKAGVNAAKTAFAALGAATVAAVVGTEAYRNEQAKLNTAFETAGSSAEVAKGVYTDLYKTLGESDQAVEAASHIAKLTTNQEEMAEWTNICQGVYATFGASLPIEGLTEAANETAKVGTVTGGLADALNWAGVSEDEFNKSLAECRNEQEREALIRKTLNGLYDDASKKFEKNNSKVLAQREQQAKLQDTLAKLGDTLAPVITAFTAFANDALAAVMPHISDFVNKYGEPLKEVLQKAGEYTGVIVDYIKNNIGVIATIAGIIGGIATAIGLYNAVAAVKAAMTAAEVTTVWALVSAYTAQAVAMATALAPYIAIVAAIAAVIAIIVLCVKHWDDIVATVKKAWEAMVKKCEEAVNAVVKWFTDLWAKIKEIVSNIWTSITTKFNEIKTKITEIVSGVKTAVVNKFTEIKDGIKDKIESAKSTVSTIFNNIKTSITEKVNAVKTTVTDVFNKVKSAITNPIETAKNTVKNIIDKIKGFFNFQWKLPDIPIPHFGITPEGWSIGDLLKGEIPSLDISWHAEGGVFDSPTLFGYKNSIHGLGEAGAEAIVPLEKNTKWLDRIAERLVAHSGSTPIVLQVDGKTFAKTSVDTINQLTRQTGSLGLNIY